MERFEAPALRCVVFAAKDILTSSAEKPDPTEKPRPGEFTTPEDEFDD